MDTDTNTEMFRTAALKRTDASFETAPRSTTIKVIMWITCLIIAAVLALTAGVFADVKMPSVLRVTLAANTGIVAILLAAWLASSIRTITLSGQTLSIKLTFWTARFDLAGLRSIAVDAKAFKCSLRTFANGGCGAFHGYFWSKRMGKFRAYVTDTSRSVVLRWENQCVVVSPKDTEYFIEEVCKRTGARRQE